jgi:hypothetical protein
MLPEPPGRQGSFCYPFPLGKPRRPAAEPARCRAMEAFSGLNVNASHFESSNSLNVSGVTMTCSTNSVLSPSFRDFRRSLQARGQCCPTLPDLPRANQPEGRILSKTRGVVEILIPSLAAADRLPQQSHKGNWIFLPRRESFKCWSTSSLKPRRSSSSRPELIHHPRSP